MLGSENDLATYELALAAILSAIIIGPTMTALCQWKHCRQLMDYH